MRAPWESTKPSCTGNRLEGLCAKPTHDSIETSRMLETRRAGMAVMLAQPSSPARSQAPADSEAWASVGEPACTSFRMILRLLTVLPGHADEFDRRGGPHASLPVACSDFKRDAPLFE